MGSERALKVCMQVLVLCNLIFVHMTGAAAYHWMAPLLALTLAAPLLERFRERKVYRLLWNAGLSAVFLILLRHASRADLAYVLEDGLVLAGLCQVHLLNNLRSSQRPDLLFFNAFLIAIVTGFMNRGIGFPLVFLLFVPAFVAGLQILNATRDGSSLGPTDTRRLVLDAAQRSCALLAASLLVFLFWPRDFQRKAFLSGKLEVSPGSSGMLEIGFNEKLLLTRKAHVVSSTRPTLSVKLVTGEAHQVSPLWRGATLSVTRAGAWHPMGPRSGGKALPLDDPWSGRNGRLSRPGGQAAGSPVLEVVRFGGETERLFAPLEATTLDVAAQQAGAPMRSRLDGIVEIAVTEEVRYRLSLRPRESRRPLGGRHERELSEELLPFVDLPDSQGIQRAVRLAAGVVADLPEESDQHLFVQRLNEHLSNNFVYLPPGSERAAGSLDEFLLGRSGGHCEFFASALATMLRSLRVPCRVVTGYRSTNWDATGSVLSFHTGNAHAWVEVYDPEAGWYAVDPSPEAAVDAGSAGFLARLGTTLRGAWDSVTGFNAEHRAALGTWLHGLPSRTSGFVRQRPLSTTLVTVVLVCAALWIRWRRRGRRSAAIRRYERALAGAKLRTLPGETPRELLFRARNQGLSDKRLTGLESAIARHERERYGAPPTDFDPDRDSARAA